MEFKLNDIEQLREIESEYNKLPDRTKEYFSEVVIKKMNNLLFLLNECESPIEELMGIALEEQSKFWNRQIFDYILQPQDRIEIGEIKYRVDFFIGIMTKKRNYSFVVECDGHDFHEKTKEQVKKDKKRERDLLVNGYQVIRFSGSEIYENPTKCAREVTKIILSNLPED